MAGQESIITMVVMHLFADALPMKQSMGWVFCYLDTGGQMHPLV